jgi:DNA mismatch repair ATPase MutL
MNGFKVVPKEPDDETSNLYLVKSLPLIKKATFSINGKNYSIKFFFLDFYELLDIINQNLDFEVQKEESKNESGKLLHKEILRPSKIYQNLASRACRASIMIGTDLDMKTMKKVVNNLSTLESPWNCPHG